MGLFSIVFLAVRFFLYYDQMLEFAVTFKCLFYSNPSKNQLLFRKHDSFATPIQKGFSNQFLLGLTNFSPVLHFI